MENLFLLLKRIYLSLFYHHPLFFFITLLCIISIIFLNETMWRLFNKAISKYKSLFLAVLPTFMILNYIMLVCWYVAIDNFSNHVDANITSVSWIFTTGRYPLYHVIDSAQRYSMVYGPMLYFINGFFLKLVGPSFFSAKIAGAISAILSLVCLFFILQKVARSWFALGYTGFISLLFLIFSFCTFRVKCDPIILLCVSLGLLGVVRGNFLVAVILTALSLGVGVNIKIHSIIYFLPIFALLYSRFGIRCFLASAFGALVLAINPFLISSQISFKNYILWLFEATKHGFDVKVLIANIEYGLFFLIPMLGLLFWRRKADNALKRNKPYFLTLFLGVIIITVMAKAGSGMVHLLPFLPSISYAVALLVNELNRNSIKINSEWLYSKGKVSTMLALLAATFIIAATAQHLMIKYTYTHYDKGVAEDISKDIGKVLMSYPNASIGMGYGGDYRLTWYRPILVFAGNPYLIDAVALMDMQKAGLKIPSKTLKALDSCQIKIWLIPKGGQAFEMQNSHWPHNQLFSDEFKEIFLKRYEIREQSKYFDVWCCKDFKYSKK